MANRKPPRIRYEEMLREAAAWAPPKTPDERYRELIDWIEDVQPHYRLQSSFPLSIDPALFEPALAELMVSDPDKAIVIPRARAFSPLVSPLYLVGSKEHMLRGIEPLGTLRVQHPESHPFAAMLPPERLLIIQVNCIYYPLERDSHESRAVAALYGLVANVPILPLLVNRPGGGKLLPGLIKFVVKPYYPGRYMVQAMCNPVVDLEGDTAPLENYFSDLVERVKTNIEGLAAQVAANLPRAKSRKAPATPGPGRPHGYLEQERINIVKAWLQAKADRVRKADFLQELNERMKDQERPHISASTLFDWQNALERDGKIDRYDIDTFGKRTA